MLLSTAVVFALLWCLGLLGSSRREAAAMLLRPRSRSKCIAVLARGDPKGRYELLHRRQAALDRLPWTRSWDRVIFHEGDIDEASCGIEARYIDVSATFRKVKPTKDTLRTGVCKEIPNSVWPAGYRAMCLFWFHDFVEYLDGFDEVMRIDDDCYLDPDQPEPSLGDQDVFATSLVQGCDEAEYTDGMVELFKSLDASKDFDRCSHPYTNVMWVNLVWDRATRARKAPVLETRCIDMNRWGDLPLWGFYLILLGRRISPLRLSYVHGSHGDYRVRPNVP